MDLNLFASVSRESKMDKDTSVNHIAQGMSNKLAGRVAIAA